MAATDITQRTLYDRVDLSVPNSGIRVRSERSVVITTAILTVILAALGYATLELLDHWSRFVVLGGIVLTTVGAMVAISPERRG